MKSNVLRAPLIKSAILLSIFCLLVYFTTTSPEGSVWSSLGAIVILVLRTVQLSVGLALGLAVCIAVLIGIFLGAVALFNANSASRMYEGLRQTILAWTAPLVNLFKSDRKEQLERRLTALSEDLQRSAQGAAVRFGKESGAAVAELDGRLQGLASRLRNLEEDRENNAVEIQTMSEAVEDSQERLAAVEENLKAMQVSTDKVSAAVGSLQPETLLGDLPARLAALEAHEHEAVAVDLTPLDEKITAVQAELAGMREHLAETVASFAAASVQEEEEPAEAEGDDHRLFSYFDNPADREKLATLVAGTLKRDMTYAQVMDYLAKEMGPGKGKVISEHPSLAKDYIRRCRRG